MEAMEEDMMMEEEVDPWGWKEAGWDRSMPGAANMIYTVLPLVNATALALKVFRYRSDPSDTVEYYAAGKGLDTKGTNYWSLMNLIHNWTGIALWSILGITNLLATFGIAGEINMMLWNISALIFAVVMVLSKVIGTLGYDTAYAETVPNTGLMQAIQSDLYKMIAQDSMNTFTLYENFEDWRAFHKQMAKDAEKGDKMEGEEMMEEGEEPVEEEVVEEEAAEVDPFALFSF